MRIPGGIRVRIALALAGIVGAALAAAYLIVVLGMGLGISTITRTQQQSMFVAFFFTLIFLLMSGLFTPVDSMPDGAQQVAEANPVKHFVFFMEDVNLPGRLTDAVTFPVRVFREEEE